MCESRWALMPKGPGGPSPCEGNIKKMVVQALKSGRYAFFGLLAFDHRDVSGLDRGGHLDKLEDDVCIGEGGSVEMRPSVCSRSSPS